MSILTSEDIYTWKLMSDEDDDRLYGNSDVVIGCDIDCFGSEPDTDGENDAIRLYEHALYVHILLKGRKITAYECL